MSATKTDRTTARDGTYLWMGAMLMLAMRGWDWWSFAACTVGIPLGVWVQPKWDRFLFRLKINRWVKRDEEPR